MRSDNRDLVLNRFVQASPATLYRRWFAPEPWTVPMRRNRSWTDDVRP